MNVKWTTRLAMSIMLLYALSQPLSGQTADGLHYPSDFSLQDLNPDASWMGTHTMERVGYCLSGGGDVNNDGYDDFVIANFHTLIGGQWNAGSTRLILGRSGSLPWEESLSNADARFIGTSAGDAVGYSAWCDGDVNGDGYDDIIIGAAAGGDSQPNNPGYVYVIFGKSNPDWGYNFDLANYADVSFAGEVGQDRAGVSVSVIPDMDNNGCDEILIGTPNNNEGGTDRGKTYLVRGRTDLSGLGISLAGADAIFTGYKNNGWAGFSVIGLDDINGDGISDFAIAGHLAGEIYIMFGRTAMDWGSSYSLSNADVTYSEEWYESWAGFQLKSAGDVNNDGYCDIIVGAPDRPTTDNPIYWNHGKTYLIMGRPTAQWTNRNLSNADASFVAEEKDDMAGWGINGNFDFNTDGYSDFMIGAWYNDWGFEDAGRVYLILGKQSGWQTNYDLGNVPLTFSGIDTTNYVGFSLSGTGDFDGDGSEDIVVSATYNSQWYVWGGKIYLFLGSTSTAHISGTIEYLENNEPVPQADIIVNGGGGYTPTDENGQYSILVDKGHDYTLVPEKSAGTDMNDAVNSYDAALIGQYIVGSIDLDQAQRDRADVDGNGSLTMYDAAGIARYGAGMANLSGFQAGSWQMSPESITITGLYQNESGRDFSAYITGDVDLSWSATEPLPKMAASLLYSSAEINGDRLSFLLKDDGESVIAFDLLMEYDPEAFEFLGVEKTKATSDFHWNVNHIEGIIRVGAFHVEPASAGEGLCMPVFRIRKGAESGAKIGLKKFRINNETGVSAEYTLRSGPIAGQPGDFQLGPAFPNPFNLSTTVQFQLPGEGHVRIECINAGGRRIRTLASQVLGTGMHQIQWDGRDGKGHIVNSGLYFIRVLYGNEMRMNKVLLLK